MSEEIKDNQYITDIKEVQALLKWVTDAYIVKGSVSYSDKQVNIDWLLNMGIDPDKITLHITADIAGHTGTSTTELNPTTIKRQGAAGFMRAIKNAINTALNDMITHIGRQAPEQMAMEILEKLS